VTPPEVVRYADDLLLTIPDIGSVCRAGDELALVVTCTTPPLATEVLTSWVGPVTTDLADVTSTGYRCTVGDHRLRVEFVAEADLVNAAGGQPDPRVRQWRDLTVLSSRSRVTSGCLDRLRRGGQS
jgi:hypothetical protein